VGSYLFELHRRLKRIWRNISAQRGLLSEGLSGEVEVGVRCFSFHEMEFRALSEGLDIPNDFAIWANNLSKVCAVLLEKPALHKTLC
jgi:hypothetical protein